LFPGGIGDIQSGLQKLHRRAGDRECSITKMVDKGSHHTFYANNHYKTPEFNSKWFIDFSSEMPLTGRFQRVNQRETTISSTV
jgi:hypothetical protein